MSVTTENSQYKAPRIHEIEVVVTDILCQSGGESPYGNEWWREEDLGDGGFH